LSIYDTLVAEGFGEPKSEPRTKPANIVRCGTDRPFDAANSVNTIEVLDWLGIEHEPSNRGEMAKCPGCGEHGALVCREGGLKCLHDRCSYEGKQGFRSNVDIVAKVRGVEPREALHFIGERFGLELRKPTTSKLESVRAPDGDWVPTDADAPDAPPKGAGTDLIPANEPQKPAEQPVGVLGAAEVFANLPPIPWAIQGLDICPGAPTLVAGYGYSGKSMALQALCLHVAAGIRVWGSFEAKQGGFIHFDWEQGEYLSRLRYQRIAYGYDLTPQDLDGRIGLVCYPTFYLDEPESFAILEKLCAGKSIAIFDSFRAACRHTDENSSEARVPLDMLARLSERTGCSMLVIHHARKPRENDAGSARDSIRGSGALYDACGSVFVLEGKPEDPERTVYHCKARVSGKVQDPMTLRIEDWGEPAGDGAVPGIRVTVAKAPTADQREKQAVSAKFERLRTEIRGLFEDTKERPGGADSIAAAIKRKASDVRAVIRVMVEEGELVATGSPNSARGYRRVGTC